MECKNTKYYNNMSKLLCETTECGTEERSTDQATNIEGKVCRNAHYFTNILQYCARINAPLSLRTFCLHGPQMYENIRVWQYLNNNIARRAMNVRKYNEESSVGGLKRKWAKNVSLEHGQINVCPMNNISRIISFRIVPSTERNEDVWPCIASRLEWQWNGSFGQIEMNQFHIYTIHKRLGLVAIYKYKPVKPPWDIVLRSHNAMSLNA